MTQRRVVWLGPAVLAVMVLTCAGWSRASENIGTVRQPLVNGRLVSAETQEEFGLVSLSNAGGGTFCSGCLLRNGWVVSAAHCVEARSASGNFTPDPARPGQNVLAPFTNMVITTDWRKPQSQKVIRIETFRPRDVALIQVVAPFEVSGSTSDYDRLVLQDGQFPYWGEPVGARMMVFGQGIHTFASGSGAAAVPSQSDGLYRMTYATPTRHEPNLYWYPAENGQMIAGGDSGGPSFAVTLSGWALVGVHALSRVNRLPGKAASPDPWMWVASTSESADAPLRPVVDQLQRIMGPLPPGPPAAGEQPSHLGYMGTFAQTPPDYQPLWVYGIRPNGELIWYRKDTSASAWQGPEKVGTGWSAFRDVIPAGGNRFYALTHDGRLMWYQHDGFNDGSFAWKPTSQVGTGWTFKRIFSGGNGIVYAVAQDGRLLWYSHNGFRDGSAGWKRPTQVGTGWGDFRDVFSTGKGAIYAVTADGTLLLYQHTGHETGAASWTGPRTVGSGWAGFQQIIPAGDGVILALQEDGKLLWYEHLGKLPSGGSLLAAARLTEAWQGPVEIGQGWQDFAKVIALMPESKLQIVR